MGLCLHLKDRFLQHGFPLTCKLMHIINAMRTTLFYAMAFALLLTACGGGGGSSNSDSALIPPLEPDQSNNGVGFAAAVLSDGSSVTSASGASQNVRLLDGINNTWEVTVRGFDNIECVVSGDCLNLDLQAISSTAVLEQASAISTDAYNAIIGRFQTNASLEYEDAPYIINDYLHFAFSQDSTEDISTVEPIAVTYDVLEDGSRVTNPTDQNGVSGSIDALTIDVDFFNQQITAFTIEAGNDAGAGTGGFSMTASLPAPIVLGGSSVHSFGLVGLVTDDDSGCSSGCLNDTATGIVNMVFLGGQAQAVLVSYNLSADTLDTQLAGVFLLERPLLFDRSTNPLPLINRPSSIAAVANIAADSGVFESYAGLASNSVTGSSVEQVVFDTTNVYVTAYEASNNFSSSVERGTPVAVGAITDLGPNDDVEAFWGLWNAQQRFIIDGVEEDVIDWLPYAYSDQATALAPTSGLVTYQLRGGSAVNEQGQVVTLNTLTMTINFSNQTIDSWNLSASYTDASNTINYTAANNGVVNLSGVDASDISIPLVGGCTGCGTGGSTVFDLAGSVSLSLIGNNAEAVIGSFQLDSLASTDGSHSGSPNGLYSLAGAYVLEQGVAIPSAPSNAVALMATVFDVPAASNIGGTISPRTTLSVSGTADGADGINILMNADNPALIPAGSLGVVSGAFDSDFSAFDQLGAFGDPACLGCIELDVDLQSAATDLLDSNSFVNTGYAVNWGRWNATNTIEYLSEPYDSTGDIHFIYSEDSTDLSALSTTTTVQYAYSPATGLGTTPTDQLGNVGSLDRVEMDINFGAQAIERFEMDLSFDNSNVWSVVMKDASVALNNNPVSSFEVEGAFGSTAVQNTGVVFGDVNITVLGPNADAVMVSYNLSVIDNDLPDNEAVGTFILEQVVSGAN